VLPLAMIVLCVVLRVLPHPPNVAPVGATAVLAGRTLPPRLAIATVLVAMFAADALLAWLHSYPLVSWVTPFVYAGFAVQALLGRALRRVRGGAIAAAVVGSLAFFALSNFGVWAAGSVYPLTPAGLAACFIAAIPFFAPTIASDLAWTIVLSLAYKALARRLPAPRWTPIPADQVAAL
jgi:hypothetical protein